ncbi:hypothetical protein SDC9_110419 [bioreactor metagenome]|uniref:Uncharacterized protein n=1 Tax=bioreactor metagenome TaxID=1076179 RepID=A0A645BDH6_9ZZZZ
MIAYFSIGLAVAGMFLAFYARSVYRLKKSGKPYRFEPVLAVILAVAIAVAWPLFIALAIKDILKG